MKNIDRETMMNILEEVFRTVLAKQYSTDENIDVIINIDKGDLEIWRKSDNSIETITIDNWEEGNSIYVSNGIALAGNLRYNSTLDLGYELYSNFPNPFDVQTTISFFVPETGNVKIAVFDLVGNMVEELANTNFESGIHNLTFNAENLAQGTYFVRMLAGVSMLTKKMDVVK